MRTSFFKATTFLCLSLIIIFCSSSCVNNKKEIKEYTINISDEAKSIRDKMFEQGGAEYLKEELFSYLWEPVINNVPQPVPEVETKNTMDIYSYMNQSIYTLSNDEYDCIVLYIHGGAWVYQIDALHFYFCDELVNTLNAKVYIPIYDLAPNATYKDTISFVKSLYKELLSQNKPVYVMGDSAGGTISLDLMHALKEDKIAMPKRLVLLAPCSDLTFSNPEMKEIEPRDPSLAIYGARRFATLWAGSEENLTSPEVSALYADVSGYPKTMLIQGTDDILCADNYALCDKLCKAGVDVTLVKGEGLFHVFSLYNIPEKAESLNLIKDFIEK